MSRHAHDQILTGPVHEAIMRSLKVEKYPDVAALKAKFPEVADVLDEHVREEISNVILHRELARAAARVIFTEIGEAIATGKTPDLDSLQAQFDLVASDAFWRLMPRLLIAYASTVWIPDSALVPPGVPATDGAEAKPEAEDKPDGEGGADAEAGDED